MPKTNANQARPTLTVAALCLGYAVFAVLLNSVGTVILQSVTAFGVDNVAASTLEACKDLTIAIVSFAIAAQVPRLGMKRAMLAGLGFAAAGCVTMALADAFWAARVLFVCVGVGFALMKVAVYGSVGVLAEDTAHHARLLGIIEAAFMAAVVAAAWIFAAFIDPLAPASPSWLHVYWWLAGACGVTALVTLAAPIGDPPRDDTAAERRSTAAMFALLRRATVLVFVAAVFLYVFIEQGIGTWLPTINHTALRLDGQLAVQAASAFAVSIALGRLAAGLIVVRTGWFPLLLCCLIGMAAIIAVVPWLVSAEAPHAAITRWADVPAAALLLPAIGFFMAPIYPTLNSVVLTTVPKARQAGLIGLIVVFSALGGTTGSRLVAVLFAAIPDARVLWCLLAPIAVLIVAVLGLRVLAARERG